LFYFGTGHFLCGMPHGHTEQNFCWIAGIGMILQQGIENPAGKKVCAAVL
jgi:hypothetical protein